MVSSGRFSLMTAFISPLNTELFQQRTVGCASLGVETRLLSARKKTSQRSKGILVGDLSALTAYFLYAPRSIQEISCDVKLRILMKRLFNDLS